MVLDCWYFLFVKGWLLILVLSWLSFSENKTRVHFLVVNANEVSSSFL
jgi:hypothetical protein